MSFEVIVYLFLRVCRIRINRRHLYERLRTHPDFPSLASFTDLLDEWKLEYSALQIEKEDLAQMEYPFLANVVTKEGKHDFEIIKNKEQIDKNAEAFYYSWTGIVIWVEPKSEIQNLEHQQAYQNERHQLITKWVLGSIAVLAIAAFLGQTGDFRSVLLGLSSLAGMITAGAIVGYTMGIDNLIAKSFCKITETKCHQVIHSGFSKMFFGIHLSNIAVSYFAGLFLAFVLMAANFDALINWLQLPILLSVILSIVTLSYQAYKQEWCRMCLLLSLVIWTQLGLLYWFSDSFLLFEAADFQVLNLVVICFAIGSGWLLIKPALEASRLVFQQNEMIRKWRQDPRWFQALLPLHKPIDKNLWPKEIFYGNPKGVLQVTLASAPYCQPCAQAHFQLDHIFQRYPEDIGIKVRFVMKEGNQEEKTAALSILKTYEQYVWGSENQVRPEQIIHDWYANQNLKDFENKYPAHSSEDAVAATLLQQHMAWGRQFNIDQTPGFFVNGHEMPNPHSLRDLNGFLDGYMENLKSSQEVFELVHTSNQEP